MKCHVCQKEFGRDFCPEHEKKLIQSVEIGVNEQGYTVANVKCATKWLYVLSYSTPRYSEYKELHQNYASVFIDSIHENYRCEEIRIPFEPEPHENYTILEWADKDTISIMIVPIDFVFIKHE